MMIKIARFFVLLMLIAGCGATMQPTTTPVQSSQNDLTAVKTYLVDKASSLASRAQELETVSQQYFDQAKAANFDYNKLWQTQANNVRPKLNQAKELWIKASPNYEQIEGIVAGVPSLADFDVILDAGSSGIEGGDNVAPYDLNLADGRILTKPGNLFGVTESSLWGTFPEFSSGVEADLDNNGTQDFGEVLPDAHVLLAASQKMRSTTAELLTAAQAWQPNETDAFTALVTMIPTMSEYFDSWKNSRFVAGNQSEQRDFVAISRLADIGDILSSLQVVYESVRPRIASIDVAQSQKIGDDLAALKQFVADVYSKEQSGKRYTPEEADLLGTEAQNRATAITGAISQVAARLSITIK